MIINENFLLEFDVEYDSFFLKKPYAIKMAPVFIFSKLKTVELD